MYKVQELDDAGQTTGPQIYVYPNQINIGEEAQAQEVVEPKKITAKVMKDFISTGVVSPGILQHIANKIADNKKLTKNEEAIRSDKSAEIFKSYKDPRLKYYLADNHTSILYQARNYALEKTNGKIIIANIIDSFEI